MKFNRTPVVVNKSYVIRELKVMLSNDLAALYQVQTKVLYQQVKCNISRFPDYYPPIGIDGVP